ncbi:MAG: hydroxylamine reductase [Mucispirillum sp.]|nr:hydroxylamine reductase [Mucispirillum sp.]
METKMFCYQCQETAGNKGCTINGVCGKTNITSNLQDLLVFSTKALAEVLRAARKEGIKISKEINHLISENLFITITNANFDDEAVKNSIDNTFKVKKEIISQLKDTSLLSESAKYLQSRENYDEAAKTVGFLSIENEDIRSLKALITFGLKGLAAYLHHANVLLAENEDIDIFLQSALADTLSDKTFDELIALILETGKYGVAVMALLDEANTKAYGNPEITEVNIGVRKNPAILISGHDLRDLEMLLKQTEGTGVDVYTHSEMLPAHYYPAFKKYSHFAGNYGSAWHNQKEDFENFNGCILLTTNCLVPPKESYKNRVYTTGAVGFAGCKHITGKIGEQKDFSIIIEHAKKCDSPKEIETGKITGGFAHNQVLSLADKIVEAVKSGAVKKFVVMAGCDGRHKSRSYYTEFAEQLPQDTIILTAGCAKYRYNKLNLGNIGGIPRVLDAGQCNDSYSLAVIALKLKEIFNLDDINKLPVIYNIAWYEQKAVIVLLALLHLGVKNILVGPTLPAFLSPNAAKVLIENFGIGGISSVDEDIKMFFGEEVESNNKITKDMIISDILKANPAAEAVFKEMGMMCLGCPASQAESLQDACDVHNVSVEVVLSKINKG